MCNASFDSSSIGNTTGIKDESFCGAFNNLPQMAEIIEPNEYYHKNHQSGNLNCGGGHANLEQKLKQLNEIGTTMMKKRSPMSSIGNYFSRSEEIKDIESFPVQIYDQ